MKPNQLIVIFIHYLNEKEKKKHRLRAHQCIPSREKKETNKDIIKPYTQTRSSKGLRLIAEAEAKDKNGKWKKKYNVHLLARSGAMSPKEVLAYSYSLMPTAKPSIKAMDAREMNWTHGENERS
jgi:hypothetical protein